MRTRTSAAPSPTPPRSEHARVAWRQLLTAAASAKLAGLRAARVRSLLGSRMIGQKTLYSFFSPSPSRKRRACSSEPAEQWNGVAAVAERGDEAVRRGGDRSWGRGSGGREGKEGEEGDEGEEGGGPRATEGLQEHGAD